MINDRIFIPQGTYVCIKGTGTISELQLATAKEDQLGKDIKLELEVVSIGRRVMEETDQNGKRIYDIMIGDIPIVIDHSMLRMRKYPNNTRELKSLAEAYRDKDMIAAITKASVGKKETEIKKVTVIEYFVCPASAIDSVYRKSNDVPCDAKE